MMIAAVFFVLTMFTVALGYFIRHFGEFVEELRQIHGIAARYIYAARAARSAWLAWEKPAIAEHRKALEVRAVADRRALERALIEAAHQE